MFCQASHCTAEDWKAASPNYAYVAQLHCTLCTLPSEFFNNSGISNEAHGSICCCSFEGNDVSNALDVLQLALAHLATSATTKWQKIRKSKSWLVHGLCDASSDGIFTRFVL